jgi:hypothetical protein
MRKRVERGERLGAEVVVDIGDLWAVWLLGISCMSNAYRDSDCYSLLAPRIPAPPLPFTCCGLWRGPASSSMCTCSAMIFGLLTALSTDWPLDGAASAVPLPRPNGPAIVIHCPPASSGQTTPATSEYSPIWHSPAYTPSADILQPNHIWRHPTINR